MNSLLLFPSLLALSKEPCENGFTECWNRNCFNNSKKYDGVDCRDGSDENCDVPLIVPEECEVPPITPTEVKNAWLVVSTLFLTAGHGRCLFKMCTANRTHTFVAEPSSIHSGSLQLRTVSQGSGGSGELKQMEQVIESKETCSYNKLLQICVSKHNNYPCYGDSSGGPLQYKLGGRCYVSGAVSYVMTNNLMSGLCTGPGAKTAYANVAVKADWIRTLVDKYS